MPFVTPKVQTHTPKRSSTNSKSSYTPSSTSASPYTNGNVPSYMKTTTSSKSYFGNSVDDGSSVGGGGGERVFDDRFERDYQREHEDDDEYEREDEDNTASPTNNQRSLHNNTDTTNNNNNNSNKTSTPTKQFAQNYVPNLPSNKFLEAYTNKSAQSPSTKTRFTNSPKNSSTPSSKSRDANKHDSDNNNNNYNNNNNNNRKEDEIDKDKDMKSISLSNSSLIRMVKRELRDSVDVFEGHDIHERTSKDSSSGYGYNVNSINGSFTVGIGGSAGVRRESSRIVRSSYADVLSSLSIKDKQKKSGLKNTASSSAARKLERETKEMERRREEMKITGWIEGDGSTRCKRSLVSGFAVDFDASSLNHSQTFIIDSGSSDMSVPTIINGGGEYEYPSATNYNNPNDGVGDLLGLRKHRAATATSPNNFRESDSLIHMNNKVDVSEMSLKLEKHNDLAGLINNIGLIQKIEAAKKAMTEANRRANGRSPGKGGMQNGGRTFESSGKKVKNSGVFGVRR